MSPSRWKVITPSEFPWEQEAFDFLRAQPDLVSVATGGIYLRLHQASRVDQPTMFLDGQRVVSLPTPSWSRDSRWWPSRSR